MILVIRLRVRAVTLKYEEPFPQRFPVQVKSRVAFTQYGNVPMLSLDEIKNGFPWLKMSENGANHEKSESRPRYMFYYVPTDAALPSGEVGTRYNSHENPQLDRGARSDLRHSFRDGSNHQFQIENDRPSIPSREFTRRFKPFSKMKNLNEKLANIDIAPSQMGPVVLMGKYLRHGSQSKAALDPSSLPKNHKFTDQDFPVGAQYLNVAETRAMPSYSYPRIPSPYMQPPRLKFEEKEFWEKNKWKSKRPVQSTEVGSAVRLKNLRNLKQKKSKKVDTENERRLKNHKPTYDREHDPEEGVEVIELDRKIIIIHSFQYRFSILHRQSSNAEVKRPRRPLRPAKEKTTQNPLLLSPDGERVQFQIHGHEGPQSYIFGFDTGSG